VFNPLVGEPSKSKASSVVTVTFQQPSDDKDNNGEKGRQNNSSSVVKRRTLALSRVWGPANVQLSRRSAAFEREFQQASAVSCLLPGQQARPSYLTEDDEYYIARAMRHYHVTRNKERRHAIDASYVSTLRSYASSSHAATAELLRHLPVRLAMRKRLGYV
jgi:hypothetical protein